MSKSLAYALVFVGVLAAGTVFAWSGKSDMKSSLDMSSGLSSVPVKAAVVSKSGDTIRLYSSDNKLFCKGDMVPIFRSEAKSFSRSRDMQSMISSTDLSNAKLIGEVRVDSLIGSNYAEGKLIVGEASHGDIITKPSGQCLSTSVVTPES